MGLDNGIIIKGKTEKGRNFLKEYFSSLEDKYTKEEYELGYWRKCWNIREKFFEVFPEEYHVSLKFKDIPKVIKILKYFLKEKNWTKTNAQSQVFSWVDELPSIAISIQNLSRVYEEYLENKEYVEEYKGLNDKDFDFYFYDSY